MKFALYTIYYMVRKTPPTVNPEILMSYSVVLDICRRIQDAGGRALLVGGCVRDALMGLDSKDFDIEVHGLSPEQLRQCVGSRYDLDLVGASFGVFKVHHYDIDISLPRVENKTGAGHRGFMVEAVANLPIEQAAARRDFTINAIMKDPLSGEILDPWKGLEDLKAKCLRHVSDHFSEDPLRVLRGMQFAARFAFHGAPETLRLCATMSQDELPRERLGTEWEKLLLKGIRPSAGLEFLRACGWLRHYPELAALVGCQQDPRWHPEGDVWQHTLRALDAAAGRRTGEPADDLAVGLAVLCHDFGKPATTRVRKSDGRIISHGHDTMGEAPTRHFVERLWNQPRLEDQVVRLVLCHMQPECLVRNNASDKAFRKLALRVKRPDLLANVAACDALAANPDADLSSIDQFMEKMQALAVEKAPPKPIILGRHLVQRGFAPGPNFKPILDKCFEAQLDGKFTDEPGGLRFLDRLLAWKTHKPQTI